MKKAIKVSIPEPCHEDWAKMTPTEKGKHCAVCTKEVVDFTSQSDEAIYKHVVNNDNTCGRFKASQLDRGIQLDRKKRTGFKPWAASFLLPFTFLNSEIATAEEMPVAEKNYTSLGIGRFSKKIERAQIITKGKVIDAHGKPIRNVKITASETDKTVWTDKNGAFKFVSLDNEVLTFSKEGYMLQSNKRTSKSETIEVQLMKTDFHPNIQIMGGIRAVPIPLEEVTGDIEVVQTVKTIVNTIEENIEEKHTKVTIKGTVTDDTGLPLPGANVIIKGTSRGTQTDFDGNYEIKTDAGAILVFSYIGFESKEVTLSNKSNTIDLNLQLEVGLMGEIVIVGYAISEEEPVITTEERRARNAKEKQAASNLRKFQQLQREKKKAARKSKRSKK